MSVQEHLKIPQLGLKDFRIKMDTSLCGICLKEFGRGSSCKMNGVLVHGYCYAKAMEFFRMLTILYEPEKRGT